MGKRLDEQVDILLDEAEDKRMCFTAYNDASRKDLKRRLNEGTLIAGELDGAQKYTDPQMAGKGGIVDAMRRERIRESRLTACCDAVVRFSMKTVGSAYEFNRLLSSFGVPKDRRPTIKIPSLPAYLREPMPAAAPFEVERVPLNAYGI